MTKTRDLADLGGGFIQAGGGVQRSVESKLQDVVSVKDFGAVGDGVTDDTAAIQAAISANPNKRVIDFGGLTFKITSAITFAQNTELTLQNGRFIQYTEAEHVWHFTSNYSQRVTLNNIHLEHQFATATAGSCLYIDTMNCPFFKWIGGTTLKGKTGIRTNGGVWMAHIEGVWCLEPYEGGIWIVNAPGAPDITTPPGGTTTVKLYKCFVTDVRLNSPAFVGLSDTMVIEQCSADRCYQFGLFRVKAFEIRNCSMEELNFGSVGGVVTSGSHHIMTVQGSGLTLDGFHVAFDPGFVPPTPTGGNVNSFVNSISNLASVSHVAGAFPAAGNYYIVNQDSGGAYTFGNWASGYNPTRAFSGAIAKDFNDILIPLEGDWQPVVNHASISGGSVNTGAVGKYHKIGNLVTLTLDNSVNSASVWSIPAGGTFEVANLPYAPSGYGNGAPCVVNFLDASNGYAFEQILGRCTNGSIELRNISGVPFESNDAFNIGVTFRL